MADQTTTTVPATLVEALVAVQAGLPSVVKNRPGGHGKYADLAAVHEVVMPLLAKNAMSWTCCPTTLDDGRFVLRYALTHVSGESVGGDYPLPAGGTPQAIGSAVSYGRRYCIVSVVGVATEDDDDGQAAEQTGTAQRRAAREQQARPKATGRTAQRAPRPAATPADAPSLPGDEGHTDGVTQAQLGKIHALFSRAGMLERTGRLEVVRQVLGLDQLTTSTDLSKTQASRLIDEMERAERHPDGLAAGLAEPGTGQ